MMWDEWSLGAKIEKADNEGRSGQGGDDGDEVEEDVLWEPASKRSHQGQLNVMQLKEAGKKEKERMQQLHQDHVDLVIVKLICVHGVVPEVIDSPEWKALMNLLNPVYKPTSANTFHGKHIPCEAVHVCQKQVEVLHWSSNLTLTFDGNSIRKQQGSVYTAHATTLNQETFFLDGHMGSSDEHKTTEWIKEKLLKVCLSYSTWDMADLFTDYLLSWGMTMGCNLF